MRINYSVEDIKWMHDMHEGGSSWEDIGYKMKVSSEAARSAVRRAGIVSTPENELSHGGLAGAGTDTRVLQADLDHPSIVELTKDLDESWEVHRASIGKTANDKFSCRVWARKREGFIEDRLAKQLLSDIRNQAPGVVPPKPDRKLLVDPHCLEMAPMDVHIGKLCWAQEVGEDYDSKIATEEYEIAVEALLAKASGFEIEQIIMPIGNDLLHVDNLRATTTAGTYQDTDTRYIHMFRRARALMSWALRRCAIVAPVRGIIVPGNHDQLATFHVGEVLAAEFQGHPSITIDNGPALRKYFKYGTNLIGFTHGQTEKVNSLPMIMANEAQKMWAETTHHEWHLGHKHKKHQTQFVGVDTVDGVIVRILPSLSAADSWHYQQGYQTHRASEAYLWHPKTGYAGHFNHSVQGE